MSVQIKVYNLPQSGWELIGLSDYLSTNDTNTNDVTSDQRNNETNNSYEITITVQLPALPSIRGFLSNLFSLGDSQNNVPTLPVLGENNNNVISEIPLVDKPLLALDNDFSNTTNGQTTTEDNSNNTNNILIEEVSKKTVAEVESPIAAAEAQFVTECREFIEAGLIELCEEGVGGTYFVKDLSGSIVAVFKPNDEEPGAPSNPKDLVQQPLLPPGGGYLREMAAYVLDTQSFAGVPETWILSNVSHPNFATSSAKTGSLQRYVKNSGASTDMGSNIFDVEAVQRIALLDLRIFNLDRNGENLLVDIRDVPNAVPGGVKPGKGLVPIDHTYSLPPITSLDSAYFEWHFWSQAKKPLSKESLEYIRSIDIEQDAKMLRALGIPESSIMTMIAMSLLLKEVAGEEGEEEEGRRRWNLFEIANFVARLPPTKPSKLEELIATCRAEVSGGEGEGKVTDANAFLVVLREKLRDIFSQPPSTK